jgi:hypothetical protein
VTGESLAARRAWIAREHAIARGDPVDAICRRGAAFARLVSASRFRPGAMPPTLCAHRME